MAFRNNLRTLVKISVKRNILAHPDPLFTDLHVYSDASETAFGMVIYIVTYYEKLVDPVFGLGRSVIKPEKSLANVQRLELQSISYTCVKITDLTKILKQQIKKCNTNKYLRRQTEGTKTLLN